MSKIKTLNVKRCVAVFVAVLMMVLSLSYTNDNQIDVIAVSKTRTYWRHDYNDTNLASHYEYTLTTGSTNNARTIFLPNNMVRDYDTAVVRIDGVGGTGFIVDDHIIATAAHCVYSFSDKKFIDISITIIDKYNNVIKTIYPKYAHINKNFIDRRLSTYDYALIYVDEDLSDYGKIYLGVAMDSYIDKEGAVSVSGFPQEYPDGYQGLDWGIRFKSSGNILSEYKHPQLLRHNVDTTYGDSGGPVYVENGIILNGKLEDYRTAIAIDVSHNNSYNTGVKITPEIFKFYMSNPYKTV